MYENIGPSPNRAPGLVRESSCPLRGWKGFSDTAAAMTARFTERRGSRERPVRILVNVIPARYCEKTTLTCDVQAPSDRPTFALTSGP